MFFQIKAPGVISSGINFFVDFFVDFFRCPDTYFFCSGKHIIFHGRRIILKSRRNILIFAIMRNPQENLRNSPPAETYLFCAVMRNPQENIRNSTPTETTLFLRDFSFNSLAQRHISLAKTYLFWCA